MHSEEVWQELGEPWKLVPAEENGGQPRLRARAPVDDEWAVELWWDAFDGTISPEQRPTEVRIFPRPSVVGLRRISGASSGVMRRCEAVVTETVTDLREVLGMLGVVSPMDHARAFVMPLYGETPRTIDGYYEQLLEAFRRFAAAGSQRPIQDIADTLEESPDTIKTRIRAARKADAAEHRRKEKDD